MTINSQQPRDGDRAFFLLSSAIEGLNLVKEIASATPAKAVIGSACVLLAMIRVCFPQPTTIMTYRLTFI